MLGEGKNWGSRVSGQTEAVVSTTLTGLHRTLAFASGVSEGIQKLGSFLSLSLLLVPGWASPEIHHSHSLLIQGPLVPWPGPTTPASAPHS